MGKTLIDISIGIFITGLVAGLFFGIQFKTGEDVNPNSIAIKIGKVVCQEIDNPQLSSQCNSYMLMLSILFLLIGVVEIIATISQVGNWYLGAVIYTFGVIVGLFIVSGM